MGGCAVTSFSTLARANDCFCLEEQRVGVVLDEIGEIFQECRGVGAVNVAVVAGDRDSHLLHHAHHAVLLEDGGGGGGGDGEDGSRVGRQDGDEGRDAEHAQVGDGE
eukprot:6175655-Pleurochrysis_carterae.AAC.1